MVVVSAVEKESCGGRDSENSLHSSSSSSSVPQPVVNKMTAVTLHSINTAPTDDSKSPPSSDEERDGGGEEEDKKEPESDDNNKGYVNEDMDADSISSWHFDLGPLEAQKATEKLATSIRSITMDACSSLDGEDEDDDDDDVISLISHDYEEAMQSIVGRAVPPKPADPRCDDMLEKKMEKMKRRASASGMVTAQVIEATLSATNDLNNPNHNDPAEPHPRMLRRGSITRQESMQSLQRQASVQHLYGTAADGYYNSCGEAEKKNLMRRKASEMLTSQVIEATLSAAAAANNDGYRSSDSAERISDEQKTRMLRRGSITRQESMQSLQRDVVPQPNGVVSTLQPQGSRRALLQPQSSRRTLHRQPSLQSVTRQSSMRSLTGTSGGMPPANATQSASMSQSQRQAMFRAGVQRHSSAPLEEYHHSQMVSGISRQRSMSPCSVEELPISGDNNGGGLAGRFSMQRGSSSRSLLGERRAARAARMEKVRQRAREKDEALLKKLETDLWVGNSKDPSSSSSEETARRLRAYEFYRKCGMVCRKELKKRAKQLQSQQQQGGSSSKTIITEADIDLLPWTFNGASLNTPKLAKQGIIAKTNNNS